MAKRASRLGKAIDRGGRRSIRLIIKYEINHLIGKVNDDIHPSIYPSDIILCCILSKVLEASPSVIVTFVYLLELLELYLEAADKLIR